MPCTEAGMHRSWHAPKLACTGHRRCAKAANVLDMILQCLTLFAELGVGAGDTSSGPVDMRFGLPGLRLGEASTAAAGEAVCSPRAPLPVTHPRGLIRLI